MKVIFWDFDGTLVYSNPLWSGSVYAALKETDGSTEVRFEDVRKHMAYGFTWHTPNEDYRNITGDRWWEFMRRHFYDSYIKLGVPENTACSAADKVRSIILKKENYTIYDDAVSALHTLKEKGFVNAVLSNNYPELEDILKRLGLRGYFDSVTVSAVEGYDKPRRELFEIAKSKYPDSRYYMIGDSEVADIAGGNSAGMTTILVHKDFCSEEADYCFDTLSSAADFLINQEENR